MMEVDFLSNIDVNSFPEEARTRIEQLERALKQQEVKTERGRVEADQAIFEAQQQLSKMQKHLESVGAAKDKAECEMNELKIRCSSLLAEKEYCSEILRLKTEETSALQQWVKTAQAKLYKVESKELSLEFRKRQWNEEKRLMQEEREGYIRELGAREQQLLTLRKELSLAELAHQNEVTRFCEELAQKKFLLEDTEEKLRTQLEALNKRDRELLLVNNQLAEAQNMGRDLERKKLELEGSLETLKAEAEMLKMQMEERWMCAKMETEVWKKQHTDLSEQRAQFESDHLTQLTQSRSEFNAKTQENISLENQLEDRAEEFASIRSQFLDLKQNYETLQAERVQENKMLHVARNLARKYKVKSDDLTKKLEAEAGGEAAATRAEEVCADRDAQAAKAAELEGRLLQEMSEKRRLEMELATSKNLQEQAPTSAFQEAQKEFEELRKKMDEQKQTLSNMGVRYASLKKEKDAAEAAKSSLQEQVKRLTSTNEELEARVNLLNSVHRNCETNSAALQSQLATSASSDRLKSTVSTNMEQNALQEASTAPATSNKRPAYGTAVQLKRFRQSSPVRPISSGLPEEEDDDEEEPLNKSVTVSHSSQDDDGDEIVFLKEVRPRMGKEPEISGQASGFGVSGSSDIFRRDPVSGHSRRFDDSIVPPSLGSLHRPKADVSSVDVPDSSSQFYFVKHPLKLRRVPAVVTSSSSRCHLNTAPAEATPPAAGIFADTDPCYLSQNCSCF